MAVGLPGTMKSSAIKEASKGRETEKKKKKGDCLRATFLMNLKSLRVNVLNLPSSSDFKWSLS